MANADIGPGAAAILHHDWPAKGLAERRRQDAGEDIGGTTWRKTDGKRDGAFRKGGMRGAERQKGGGPGQKGTAPAEFGGHEQGVSFFFGHGAAYGQSLRLAAKRCQAG
jgi:hypothetical protein